MAIQFALLLYSTSVAFAQCNPEEVSIIVDESLPPSARSLWFGRTLDLYGDTIAIGSRNHQTPSDAVGAVHIFQSDGTTWTEEARLTASGSQSIFAQYGAPISLDENLLLVSAVGGSGRVYVYERLGTAWVEQPSLYPNDPLHNSAFGSSISVSGSLAAIGASGNVNAGAVYIFESSDKGWSQTAKIDPPDDYDGYRFGKSVQLDGNSLLVGSSSNEQGVIAGSIFVYARLGTKWVLQQELLPADNSDEAHFGRLIRLDGDTLAVSASSEAIPGTTAEGVVYVYSRVDGLWELEQRILPPAEFTADTFGSGLALSQGLMVVGDLDNDSLGTDSGAAYVYQSTIHGWVLQEILTASDATEHDQFGNSIVMNGDQIYIGAYTRNDAQSSESGAVYAFDVRCIDSGECAHPQLLGSVETPNQAKGLAVSGYIACVADFNAGLQVIDISNPPFPKIIGSHDTTARASDVEIVGATAFVAQGNAGLITLDITDPTAPIYLGEFDSQGSVKDITVEGDYAYLADNFLGVVVLDVSDPTNIVHVGTHAIADGAIGLEVKNNIVMAVNGNGVLQVIIESTPGIPESIGSVSSVLLQGAVDVDFDGVLAAVAAGNTGVLMVDISVPDAPLIVGLYDNGGIVESVLLTGNTVYFTGTDSITLLDISDPASPYSLGRHPKNGDANAVAIQDAFIYVADDTSGFEVFTLKDDCRGCQADLTGDNILDFFDISTFLTAYSNADLVADFSGDGILDFFDISAFLTAYSQGCP